MHIQLELNYDTIIDLLGFSSSLMLGLFFLSSKPIVNHSNIFISLFLWSLSIEIMNSILSVYPNFSPILKGSFFTITFLLLYLISRFDHPSFKWFGILLLPGMIQNVWPLNSNGNLFENTFNLFLLFVGVYYINKYQSEQKEEINQGDNEILNWLKQLFYIFIGFHFLWIIQDITIYIQVDYWITLIERISDLSMLVVIIWIGHNIFSHPEYFIVQRKMMLIERVPIELTQTEKVQQQEESKKDQEIFEEVQRRLVEERLFIDPKLSVRSLSQHIGINEKELSRLINKYTDENFYHFINQYRVKEFKILIEADEKQHLSILGLAEESGFNSKSTFYAVFKAFEGTTPKQYVLSVKESK